ncbi:MAG: hypothetical protein FD165_2777 [Gammaproteobacteria bacterium]|nr:MAG: hypothetical protein FD165_2777 [Gammaproteobacteria bacterium]
MKRKNVCRVYRCTEPPYLGGLCKVHADEDHNKTQRRSTAVDALHYGVIDKALPSNPAYQDDFSRLCRWWNAACDSVNHRIPHKVLRDEAESALGWCIALAQDIIDAERAFRSGATYDSTLLDHQRKLTWERFDNLERGLMSNGVERPKSSDHHR